MDKQVKEFEQLLKQSQNILITSHISPDPDALSSVLLMGTTIKMNFPDKHVAMVFEEEPLDLDFLYGYKSLEFKPLADALKDGEPQLLIMLDANSYGRASRLGAAEIRDYVAKNQVKEVIIDHHEPAGKDDADVFINQGSPATVQDIYEVLFWHLELDKPAGYAEIAMTGLYSDSGGFIYENARYKETLRLIAELVEAGVSIESIKSKLERYSTPFMKTIGELAKNLSSDHGFTYSYVRDEFLSESIDFSDMQRAVGHFTNSYVRNIDGITKGFVVYPDTRGGKNSYSASFRTISGTGDVAVIASRLGGGGHKSAAGAKFKATSIDEALDKVKAAIAA